MYEKGQIVRNKRTGMEYVIVEPSDRAFHGVHNFWVCRNLHGGYTTQFSAKEIEAV